MAVRRGLLVTLLISFFAPEYVYAQALSCNFDSAMKNSTILPCKCDGSNCTMEQVTETDDLDWLAWQGPTPSVPTGPSGDHTQNGAGLYIYFEATDRQQGDQAVIITNSLSLGETSCLTFWYHMFGYHMGSLQVQATFSNGGKAGLWEKIGEQPNGWLEATVPLHSTVTGVSFVATKGGDLVSDPFSDFALDDIMIKRQPCPGSTNPTTPDGTHSSSLATPTTRTSTTSTTTSTSSSTSQSTPSLGTTTTKSSPSSSSMMSSTPPTTHKSTSSNTVPNIGSTDDTQSGASDRNMVIIVVVVVVVILVIVAVLVALLILKKRGKSLSDESEAHTYALENVPKSPVTKKPPSALPSMNPDPKYINSQDFRVILHKTDSGSSSSETDPDYTTPASSPPENQLPGPIFVDSLERYVAKKRTNLDQFTKEYKSLPQADMTRCTIAQTDDNKDKNRFKNIFPYDDTRPILSVEEDTEFNFGEYINGSYLPGYDREKEYIATQGPRPVTVVDFWRLVWQENVNRIVMVANLVDDGKKRVEKYWPEMSEYLESGDFIISCDGAVVCADYTTRILTVQKGNDARTINQFHFTSWEDKNKPLFGAMTLFAFHRKVSSFSSQSTGPMLVHCSAGVGRTGTFIVFDILLKQAEQEGQLDIYGWIKKLRHYRMLIVQSKEQYFFLHDALVEYLKTGPTSYKCYNFGATLQRLKELDPKNGNISEIQRQYNVLSTFKTQRRNRTCDGEIDQNKKKNRDMEVLPGDNHRPYLSTQYEKGNNYINAVFVSGFKKHGQYIVTQMPLKNTVVDLWRLVWDHSCHTIVMLNSTDGDKQPYWPKNEGQKLTYGPIEIELLKINLENARAFVVVRDIKVKLANQTQSPGYDTDEKSIMVRHFQLLSWPDNEEIPQNPEELLDLQEMVHSWQQQRMCDSHKRSHVIVHCGDGASKSGLYCAVSHTLDRMKVEQEVDAFLAVRYVARSRPQFIKSLNQYTFLYQMALEFMIRHNEYANFQ